MHGTLLSTNLFIFYMRALLMMCARVNLAWVQARVIWQVPRDERK